MKASLLPNRKLCSFKVKDALGRPMHFGPKNKSSQGEIIASNFFIWKPSSLLLQHLRLSNRTTN
jgi:hypothetical protein